MTDFWYSDPDMTLFRQIELCSDSLTHSILTSNGSSPFFTGTDPSPLVSSHLKNQTDTAISWREYWSSMKLYRCRVKVLSCLTSFCIYWAVMLFQYVTKKEDAENLDFSVNPYSNLFQQKVPRVCRVQQDHLNQ